jgi:hypothetical protein
VKFPAALELAVERADAGWRWKVKKPEGATAIRVERRPPRSPMHRPKKAGTPETPDAARKLLDEANAEEAFAPIEGPAADGPWEGTWTEPGLYRVVVVTPTELRVATKEVE